MRKTVIQIAAIAATLLLSSCGTMGNSGMGLGSLPSNGGNLAGTSTGSTQTGNTAGKVIESLIGNLLNSSATLSQKDLTGTWQYVGADCAFKSENFLMKAGGEVAAAKIEEQLNTNLAKVGIKSGTCSFTFKEDNTYSAKIGRSEEHTSELQSR